MESKKERMIVKRAEVGGTKRRGEGGRKKTI